MEKYTYECDGGSLAIGTGSVVACYPNNYGDGAHTVYITDELSPDESRNSVFTGAVEGSEIKVYNYDCLTEEERADEKNVLVTLSGRYGVFAVKYSGDMILEKWD